MKKKQEPIYDLMENPYSPDYSTWIKEAKQRKPESK